MFNKLMAFGIKVNNFAKLYKFYKDVLKLKPKKEDLKNEFAEFFVGEGVVALLTDKTLDGMCGINYFNFVNNRTNFVIAVEVKSVKKAVDDLRKKDVEIVTEPKTTPWGQKVAYFRDPEGNIWELSEPFSE